MRISEVSRKTKETEVYVKVNIDSKGIAKTDTGIAFLDHMISSLSTHSLIDITVKAKGDLKHHITEDVAICLGRAFRKALGEGTGITRFGNAIVPMDHSLAFSAIDLVKRFYARIDLNLKEKRIEDMPCEDINHFLETFVSNLQANIHLWVENGTNDHHKAEAAVKALALSLRQAVNLDSRREGIPSSKGQI